MLVPRGAVESLALELVIAPRPPPRLPADARRLPTPRELLLPCPPPPETRRAPDAKPPSTMLGSTMLTLEAVLSSLELRR
eukprot:CAMPEP_0172609302 /NCGR_PEP_ID=MMETSP1068-20121228/29318_1 /TAXON_ID=35684 /ORGANISM="Pseudopedinella elastica, Strain CCMP716" /LENGTH=79 /DNA_ID=CAMNT_0013412793 /DNA_START=190 /DNA_END=425 /DNA_ORIENTATION=+